MVKVVAWKAEGTVVASRVVVEKGQAGVAAAVVATEAAEVG